MFWSQSICSLYTAAYFYGCEDVTYVCKHSVKIVSTYVENMCLSQGFICGKYIFLN